jgi:hypothetical protein
MKKIPYILVLIGIVALMFVSAGCGPGTAHVSVGVGVAYPGAWGPYGPGPYGGAWVGRPIYWTPIPFPLF